LLRLRRSLGGSNAGLLYLNRTRRSGLPDDDNQTIGADANLLFLQTDLRISSALVKTVTPGRAGSDWAGKIIGEYQTNLLRFFTSYVDIGRNFNPEMGFVQRPGQGVRIIGNEFELRPRFDPETRMGKWVRDIIGRFSTEQVLVWNGPVETQTLGTEERSITPSASVEFADSGMLSSNFSNTFERLASPFRVSGVNDAGENVSLLVPVGDYRSNRRNLSYSTDRSKMFSGNAGYNGGDYYGGSRTTWSAGLRYHLDYRLTANFTYDRNNVELVQGNLHTDQLSFRADYNFTTRMSLSSFIQYNNSADQIASNIRFRLIHRPLSDIYVVYNDLRDRLRDTSDWGLTIKYTHLLTF
jgi:hypothetical protein